MKSPALLLIGVILATAGRAVGQAPLKSLIDVAYGTEKRQKLDLYVPGKVVAGQKSAADSTDKPPVLVFVHGGAWKAGSKGVHRFVGQSFARSGILTVVAGYRLHPEVVFPAFVEDAAAAVTWARENAASHGGDPDRIFLAGHSAGGHIVALLGTDERYLGEPGSHPEWLRGIISLAGVYDMDPGRVPSIRPVFGGAAREECMAAAFVDPKDPRFFLLHGHKDLLVPFKEATSFQKVLTTRGKNPPRTSYHGDAGHTAILLRFAATDSSRRALHEEVLEFLRAPK